VADVDLVEGSSAGVVFDDTKVVVDIAGIGVSSELLELCCAGHFSFLLADQAVRIGKATLRGFAFWANGRITWKFKGVLDDIAIFFGMAALGYFGFITTLEVLVIWFPYDTFHYPEIHDGNWNIMHAVCCECEEVFCSKIFVLETLCLSEASRVAFGEDGDVCSESILHLKFYVRGVLEGNRDWHMIVICFTFTTNQFCSVSWTRWRTRRR